MITYLIYSTACMGLLLLFYHSVLEKEKMHHINRVYLIFSLIFSLSIPLIPVGMADSVIPWFQNQQISEIQYLSQAEWLKTGPEEITPASETSGTSLYSLAQVAFLIYAMVAGVLFVRLIRIIHMIQLKADRNPRKLFDDYEIVLLSEKVIPHTFNSTIFLNKDQYLKGEIAREIMVHELTHARQKHTLDILLVEILKIVFWFNPVLYFYKKAMLLNHEFLADEAVISTGAHVSEYQNLLLKSLTKYPSHGLISQFNYTFIKMRLRMITQRKSKIRSSLKIAALIPLFGTLTVFLGCEPSPSEYSEQEMVVKELTIEISDSETLNVNGSVMNLAEFEEYLSKLTLTPDRADLEVNANATTGMVMDVQQLLREHELLRINYSMKEEPGDTELDRVTDEYLEAAYKYMGMSVEDTDLQVLKRAYDGVIKKYNVIPNVEIRNPDFPPPPPLVPSPEERIESAANSHEPPNSPPSPPEPVETRNLLQILMNEQGMLLMNTEPARLDEVKNKIKQFVDNNGANPDLSENPQEAVVSIKTLRSTPYDLYTEFLDEVMAAYEELRDEAAQRQFGTTFSALPENSEQRTEIREMYPKKISVVPPDRN